MALREHTGGGLIFFSNNAAMDFNSGAPVSVDNSVMNQFEGSSSIADCVEE